MKLFFAAALFVALIATSASAQTLGQATQEVRDRAEAMLTEQLPAVDSWGEQTAIDDLRRLHQSSAALLAALEGSDALELKPFQASLSSASRRLHTSQSLLPDAARSAPAVADLQSRVAAIDARLTDLRLRFGELASLTPGPLAEIGLSTDDQAFAIYDNPQTLLIDVRDARRLSSELRVGRFAGFGFDFGQPNNLDSLQVRRMVLAAWDLERALEGRPDDISEVLDEWFDFRREYDRMGYPGSSTVTRQLERVMERLTLFFDGVASPGVSGLEP